MSQESTEDPFENFSENFIKALLDRDFVTVFTMWKRLESRLDVKEKVPEYILAIRDFANIIKGEVMFWWCSRIQEFCDKKVHDEVVKLHEALLIRFPWAGDRQGLIVCLDQTRVLEKVDVDHILLCLVKAYLRAEGKDSGTGRLILVEILDSIRKVPAYIVEEEPDYDENVSDDFLEEAIELRFDLDYADGHLEPATDYVESWKMWCKGRRRYKVAHRVERLLEKLKEPADVVPPASEPSDSLMDKDGNLLTDIDLSAWLTPADLAERFGVPLAALRARLRRWREKHFDSGWKEVADRKPREDKYMYQVGAILPIIKKLKQKTSG